MGLDIYVGSFTRYYSGDWETVVQRMSREQGIPVEVVRPGDSGDAAVDPNEIRAAVLAWRDQLSKALGDKLDRPLDWDESDGAPYFTDKPAWDSYFSLLLWAAYAEHADLKRPHDCIEDWATDAAFQRSAAPDFNTRFPQLMHNVQVWLPLDESCTFAASGPPGEHVGFGSSFALCEQLGELNRRTWNASDSTISEWRRAGAEYQAPMEVGARFAFAIMLELAREAVAHRLIMKLDY